MGSLISRVSLLASLARLGHRQGSSSDDCYSVISYAEAAHKTYTYTK